MKKNSFSLHPTDRQTILVVIDGLILVGSVLVALWRRSSWEGTPYSAAYLRGYIELFGFVALWVVAIAVSRGYDLRVASRLAQTIKALVASWALVLGVYFVVFFFAPREALPRAVVLLQGALAFGGLVVWRALNLMILTRPSFHRRVLIVGAGVAGRAVAEALELYGRPIYSVVAFWREDQAGSRETPLGIPVEGPAGNLLAAVERHRVSEVVIAVGGALSGEVLSALLQVQEQGVQVTPMPLMYEALTGQVPAGHIRDDWYSLLPLDHPQTRAIYAFTKRALDCAVAIPTLLVLAALLPLLALAIKLDSRGPVFFEQSRIGKYGKRFTIYKLRTMAASQEGGGRDGYEPPATRVTRVGRVLRAMMLDEIPQMWNVLKGEMSIVGPRPEVLPELEEALRNEVPFYRLRHAVAPGMAGWAMLHEGYDGQVHDAVTKVSYDLYYIKHQSLWLDVQIILRTMGRGLSLRRSERRAEPTRTALR